MQIFGVAASSTALALLLWGTSFLYCHENVSNSLILETPLLTESSGIAADSSERLWSHNDSGDSARLFRFDQNSGSLLKTATFPQITPIDWEDICAFEFAQTEFVAIADVGDNLRKRKSVQVHFVRLELNEIGTCQSAELAGTVDITYPNGPVNCEAICFDSKTRRILLPSKETTRTRFYSFEADAILTRLTQPAENNAALAFKVKAELLGEAPVPLATGADISADGQHLVLCTYGPGAWISRTGERQWNYSKPRLFRLPYRKQGEAIGFSRSGEVLFLTSEFAPTPLSSVQVSEVEFAK